jgi:hypothetical protein
VTLPNAHLAIVDRQEVSGYLLNAAHPDNQGKAQFFEALGYVPETTDRLIDMLRAIAGTSGRVKRVETPYGEKYVVDGFLPAHAGERAGRMLRTVRFVRRGENVPRFVTAYPLNQ